MVDREKVIKWLEHCEIGGSGACYEKDCPYYQSHDCTDELKNDILVTLKEQEPKTGHWIESAGADKCSVCGETYSDLYPDYQYTHYCPNCGAKMIG